MPWAGRQVNPIGWRLGGDLVTVAISTAVKLAGTVILFALLARSLGSSLFGDFSYWYAVGILLAAFSDYGFSHQILAEISSRKPDAARNDVRQLAFAKSVLSAAIALVALVVAALTCRSLDEFVLAILLVQAGIFGSFFEFYAMVLRSRRAYRAESRLATFHSLGGNLVAGALGYVTHSPIVAAAALLAFRIGAAFLARQGIRGALLPGIDREPLRLALAFQVLKRGSGYAADNVATQVFVNLDTLVVKHLFDSSVAGVYLAGTRLVQAAMAGIIVLASVFLPALSIAGPGREFRQVALALVLLSGIGGGGMALIFAVGRLWLPVTIFGNAFAPLADLLPVFGLFVMFRYIAAAPGVVLTAVGFPALRAGLTGIGIVAAIVAGAVLFSLQGEVRPIDLCLAMMFGAISQAALFATAAWRKKVFGDSPRPESRDEPLSR